VQDRILEAVVKSLAPKGVFTTFAYLHAAWLPTAVRFRKRLKQHFGSVKTSRIVWRNLPPAYVYRCRL
jgi:phospholipid N-methyltransferase